MDERGIPCFSASVVMEAVCSSNVARGGFVDEELERASRRESREAEDSEVKWTVLPAPTSESM